MNIEALLERLNYYTELLEISEVDLKNAEIEMACAKDDGNESFVEWAKRDIASFEHDIRYAKGVIRETVSLLKTAGVDVGYNLI